MTVRHTTAQKTHLRRLKLKSGPSAARRREQRRILQPCPSCGLIESNGERCNMCLSVAADAAAKVDVATIV